MKRIHCIGIGGSGLSGLAQLLHTNGNTVSGSDCDASQTTAQLAKKGISIAIGHYKRNITSHLDEVIYSLAIPPSNPELKEARRRHIRILSYPQKIGELTRDYYTIAVCGTHGKTTITAMLAKIFIENNFDPTVIVGAALAELNNSNYRAGKSKLLILEACEYKAAFLNYHPAAIVLHTLEADHFDYYRNFKSYLTAFRAFIARLKADGYLFANVDDERVRNIKHNLPAYNFFTYRPSRSEAKQLMRPQGATTGADSKSNFRLVKNIIYHNGKKAGDLSLKIPGSHNRSNALAAFAVANTYGITPHDILKSLNRYEGASRRFEIKGKFKNALLIDDYAHHPTEIKATLEAARERFPKEKICAVFQPHQYSRTKHLLKEFGRSFKDADSVIIPNIYGARDSSADIRAVSTERLVEEIKKHNSETRDGGGLKNTAAFLKTHAAEFDVILTMGAGDVWKVAEALVKK